MADVYLQWLRDSSAKPDGATLASTVHIDQLRLTISMTRSKELQCLLFLRGEICLGGRSSSNEGRACGVKEQEVMIKLY